jgi:uncharacterized protein (TIGR00251 family)
MKKNFVKEVLYPNCIKINKNNGVNLKFLVKPNANISKLTDIDEEEIGIQISAPPLDDEANKELQRFLSKLFSISKSQIVLIKGHKSREKIVEIKDSDINVIYKIINDAITND